MRVYARDLSADEMYNETGNFCLTRCDAQHTPFGDLDLEKLTKDLNDEGWLLDNEDLEKDFFMRETDEIYEFYNNEDELEFFVKKIDD